MRYPNIVSALFRSRPNRFVAYVEIRKQTVICHVKNTGRCKELLVPGTVVWLTESDNPARKTRFDLVAVEKQTSSGPLLINMDSQAPNQAFAEWARAGGFRPDLTLLQAERTWGDSRFDFAWTAGERKGFVEVKGVTLEENGVASFPDAPTQRGVKHLRELIRARQEGYEAAVCFVVQMSPMRYMTPNDATHPAFGETLRQAARAGVDVLALECAVTPDTMTIQRSLPVVL